MATVLTWFHKLSGTSSTPRQRRRLLPAVPCDEVQNMHIYWSRIVWKECRSELIYALKNFPFHLTYWDQKIFCLALCTILEKNSSSYSNLLCVSVNVLPLFSVLWTSERPRCKIFIPFFLVDSKHPHCFSFFFDFLQAAPKQCYNFQKFRTTARCI